MSWFSKPASETQITHGNRLWLYVLAGLVMFFLVAPLIVVIPLSFTAEPFLSFTPGMLNLEPEAFSLRWYLSSIEG